MKKLWEKMKKNSSMYFFLLPSVLVMLVIIGYPLLKTFHYSFTNLTDKTLVMDSEKGKKQNKKSILELTLITRNLKKIVRQQETIINLLKKGRGFSLVGFELNRYQIEKNNLKKIIDTANNDEIETSDGFYKFMVYYSLNIQNILEKKAPRTTNRATLVKFELSKVEGIAGIRTKLKSSLRTLVDKKKKSPTKFVGFQNYAVLFGFSESDNEKLLQNNIDKMSSFFISLTNQNKTIINQRLREFFKKNPESVALLNTTLSRTPQDLEIKDFSTNFKIIPRYGEILKNLKTIKEKAYDFANQISKNQNNILAILRSQDTKITSLSRKNRDRINELKKDNQKIIDDLNKNIKPSLTNSVGQSLTSSFLVLNYKLDFKALIRPITAKEKLANFIKQEKNNYKMMQKIILNYPKDFGFWNIFFQTIIWTLVNVSLHFLIGLYLAHWLNKQLKGNTMYRTFLLLPWTVPSFVAAFSWRLIFDYPGGVLNSIIETVGGTAQNFMSDQWILTACIIVNVWVGVPFMMITLLGGLQTIPSEQYEAADIDGANAFQKLIKVTLPGLKPIATVTVLLGAIWTFNMFNIIYLVTLGIELRSKNILITYAYEAFQKAFNYAEAATYGVIILSMLLVFGMVYIRVLKKGEED